MPFDPADITGLKVRLEANAGFGGFSNNDPVSTWADQSGGGHDFTGSGSTRPLWKTNIAGSQPGILWDNSNNNHLDSADLSALFPSAGTVFIVYDPNGDDGYQLARNLSNDSWTRWDGNGDGYAGLFRTTRINNYPSTMPTTAGRHSYAIKSSSSTYVAYKDGVAQSAQSAGYNAGTVWYLGEGEGNGSRRFGGYMFAIYIYDTALSDSDITSLETYSEALWSYGPVNGAGTPNAVSGVGAIPDPTAKGGGTGLPSATAGTGAVPAPTGMGTGFVLPSAVAGIGSVPAATAVGSSASTSTPSVVAGIGAVPAPTARGASVTSPSSVAGVGAVPAAAENGNGTAVPAVVAGAGSIPAPTVFGATVATPGRVIGIGAVPAPTAIGGYTATAVPSAVAAIGRVPFPNVEGEGTGGGGGSADGAQDYWSIVLAS